MLVFRFKNCVCTCAVLNIINMLLSPGMVITLGGGRRFRFNHPAEAAVLRERRRVIIIVYMLLVVGEIQNTANLDFFLTYFQTSEGNFGCNYVDLCTSSVDHRYDRLVRQYIYVWCRESLFCQFTAYIFN